MDTFGLSSCGVSATPSVCHRRLHNTQPEYPQIGLQYTRIHSVN